MMGGLDGRMNLRSKIMGAIRIEGEDEDEDEDKDDSDGESVGDGDSNCDGTCPCVSG